MLLIYIDLLRNQYVRKCVREDVQRDASIFACVHARECTHVCAMILVCHVHTCGRDVYT